MKNTFSAVAMVAVSIAVNPPVAGATQERIRELSGHGATDGKSTTLTGCVERGSGIGSYTLREATERPTTTSNVTPRLSVAISSTDVNIGKHVGHSVSVMGSYAKAERATGAAGTSKPVPPPGLTTGGDVNTRRSFTVTSLKLLASSCQQST
jgi:hypothetical protein